MSPTRQIQKKGSLICQMGVYVLALMVFFLPVHTTEATGKVTNITIALQAAGGMGDAVAPAILKFNEQFKGRIHANIARIPFPQINERVMMDLIGKTAGYDVIPVNSAWKAQFVPFCSSIEKFIKSDPDVNMDAFPQAPLADCYYNGTPFSLPARAGVNIMYYRKDLFKQAGLTTPKTHQEYLEAAIKLTKDTDGDGKPEIYGTSFAVQFPGTTTVSFANFLWTAGGQYLDEKFKHSALMKPESIYAGRFVVDLLRKYYVVPEGVLGWCEWVEELEAFLRGDVAIYFAYSPRVLIVEDPTRSKVAGKVGYDVIPLKEGVEKTPGVYYYVGWNFAINGASQKKGAAWELIKYLSSYETQKYLALEAANGPTRKDVMMDPDFEKVYPAARPLLETMKHARCFPPIPEWAKVADIFHEQWQFVLTGTKTVEKAFEDASKKINAALAE